MQGISVQQAKQELEDRIGEFDKHKFKKDWMEQTKSVIETLDMLTAEMKYEMEKGKESVKLMYTGDLLPAYTSAVFKGYLNGEISERDACEAIADAAEQYRRVLNVLSNAAGLST